MHGLPGAIALVTGTLRDQLRDKTTELRGRYDDPSGARVPDVVTIEGFDRHLLPVEKWPAVLVTGLETVSLQRVTPEPHREVWHGRYRLRCWVWVRGQDEAQVADRRGLLGLAVRECLLTHRELSASGVEGVVDDGTLTESWSEMARDEEGSAIAGMWLQFEVTVTEYLDTVTTGVVASLEVDTKRLPQHPAFD